MMKILIINPVKTNKWDKKDTILAKEIASKDTLIDVFSFQEGPLSIETPEDEAEAIPLIVKFAIKNWKAYNAIIVNCFLDPAVSLLKGIIKIPVVGPCEASLALASIIGKKIGIITVNDKAIWMIEDRVNELNFKDYVIHISGIPIGVLDIDENIEYTKKLIIEESIKANKKGCEVIILGCTALAGLAKEIQDNIELPVIDPFGAAIKVAESLIKLNLYNSRYGK
jgi:allantoin racemase